MPTIKIKVKKLGSFDFADKSSKAQLQALTGMRRLIEDIHAVSRPITPMKTGDLRGDVKKTTSKVGDIIRGTIEWDRPYAWYQERGYGNGGAYKRYTTPGTGAHFAEISVKAVTAHTRKYFGRKI